MKKRSTEKKARWFRSFTAAAALVLTTLAAHALDPPYLAQLPSVEKVLADNQGKDRLDTLARQQAALNQLARAIGFLAGDREFCCQTQDEQVIRGRYGTAARDIDKETFATLSTKQPSNPFRKSERGQWVAVEMSYERDPEFRAANFARYLGPDLRAALDVAYADFDRRLAGEAAPTAGRLVELSPGQRQSAQLVLWGVLALMVLAVVREFRPFGARKDDPLKIVAGFRLYNLSWRTGHVTNYTKWTETSSGSSTETDQYGNRRTHYWYHTYEHEAFSLVGPAGTHNVHVVDAAVHIPEGHLATAVWATRRRHTGGDYVLFFDRTAPRTKPLDYWIGKMLKVRLWVLFPVFALALAIGGAIAAATNVFAGTSPTFVSIMSVFVAWVVAIGWINRVVIPRRVRRFRNNDAPRILDAIVKKEPPDTALVTNAATG
jgi:hypothetical protein